MEVNALLCDHAQVSGKLFVSGAGIDAFTMQAGDPGPYVLDFSVAGVVHVPWTATNAEHRLQLLITDEDGRTPELGNGAEVAEQGLGGEIVFNVGRPAGMPSGDEQLVPFAFPFRALPLARLGQYGLSLVLDGEPVRRLAFRVRAGWVDH